MERKRRNLKLYFSLTISKFEKMMSKEEHGRRYGKMKESKKISLNFNRKEEKRNNFSCFGCDYYSFNHIGRNKYKFSSW